MHVHNTARLICTALPSWCAAGNVCCGLLACSNIDSATTATAAAALLTDVLNTSSQQFSKITLVT
jgi:hypothetical protein